MPAFQFGELAPDQADLGDGMVNVRNVLPGPSGYLPFRTLVAATDELDLRPRGAIQARDQSGEVFQYAGDESKLYQNVDGVWTAVGTGYSTGTNEAWEFANWKNKIIATNFSDDMQVIDFGGVAFADLTAEATRPKARHIAAVRDFVVVGNTFDTVDGDVPSRVRWCGFNDETTWEVSPVTLSDYQDLKTSKVERIFGGEYAVILQPDKVWRMTFAGAPVVWQFDEVLPGIGVIAPGAAAQDGEVIYFLSSKGFFALERGTAATPIGIGRVDEFVRRDLDLGYLHRMSTVADPHSKRVFWGYPGTGNVGGRPNRIMVYDRAQNRWSIIDQEHELLWSGGGTGVTLDSPAAIGDPLNIDDPDADVSFDDPRWVGGAPFISAFDANFAAGAFNGPVRDGLLLTKEFVFSEGRTQLNGFRARIQGGTVTARVGTRNSLGENVVYGPVLTARPEQRFTTRANARYHHFELTLSGEWQHAIGLEIGKNDLRSGGVRG